MARKKPWMVSDNLRANVEPLVPRAPNAKGGNPRIPDAEMFALKVYDLTTGIHWNALPRELEVSPTVHDHFQGQKCKRLILPLSQASLTEHGELRRIGCVRHASALATHLGVQ